MVLLWFFGDYIKKAKKKLEEKTVYKNINFKETILSDLVDKNNKILKSFTHANLLRRKNSNTFPMISGKKTNLGKLYLLPKINKRLYNVGRGPVLISN